MSDNIYFILMMITVSEMVVLSLFGFINLKLKKRRHSSWKIVSSKTIAATFMAIAILSYVATVPIVIFMGMSEDCWIMHYPVIVRMFYILFYVAMAVGMHTICCAFAFTAGGLTKKLFLQKEQKQLNHRRKELLSRSYETRRREQEEYFSALQTINAWAEMSEA